MTRTDRVAKGYCINVLQLLLYMALQGLLAPLILKFAGVSTLGAYGAVMQIVAYYSILDYSLSMTLSRNLAQSQEGDVARFRAIFTTGRTCLLFSGCASAVVAVLIAGPFVTLLRLPPAVARDATLALYLLAGWFILRTPVAAYDAALMATQNLATAHTITGIQNVARALGSLTAVLLGFGLVGMVSAAIFADLAAGSLYRRNFTGLYPDHAPAWGLPDSALLKIMLSFTVHALAIQLATMLTFASGQLMAGYLAGAVGVSIIYTNQLPAQMAYSLILRLADNASPAINELKGKGEVAALRQAFFRIHRLTLNLSIPLAFGILLFNRTLISRWVGPAQYGGALMSAALAALTVVVSIEHVNVVFAMAMGREKTVARFAAVEAALALALSCLFGRMWGVGGIPAGITVAILPKTFYLLKLHGRTFQSTLGRYARECLLPAAAAGSAALAAAALLAQAAGMSSLAAAGAAMLLFCSVYATLSYAVCLRPDERLTIRRYASILFAQLAGARVRPLGLNAR
jgi:O-antigen/teichoic acid export membrane protein